MRYGAIMTEFHWLTADDDAMDESLSSEKDPLEGATVLAQVSDHLSSAGSEVENRKLFREDDFFNFPQNTIAKQIDLSNRLPYLKEVNQNDKKCSTI